MMGMLDFDSRMEDVLHLGTSLDHGRATSPSPSRAGLATTSSSAVHSGASSAMFVNDDLPSSSPIEATRTLPPLLSSKLGLPVSRLSFSQSMQSHLLGSGAGAGVGCGLGSDSPAHTPARRRTKSKENGGSARAHNYIRCSAGSSSTNCSPSSSSAKSKQADLKGSRRGQRRVMFSSTPLASLNASPPPTRRGASFASASSHVVRKSKFATAAIDSSSSPAAATTASSSPAVRAPLYHHRHPYSQKPSPGSSEYLRQQRRHRVYSNPSPRSVLLEEESLGVAPASPSTSSSPSARFLHHHQQHQRLFGRGSSSSPLAPPPSSQLPAPPPPLNFLLPSPPPSQRRPPTTTASSNSRDDTTGADTSTRTGDEEEADGPTEDELEEEFVEQLLLVTSPPRPVGEATDLDVNKLTSSLPLGLGLRSLGPLTPPPSSELDEALQLPPGAGQEDNDDDDEEEEDVEFASFPPLPKGILKPFDERAMGEQTSCAEEGKRRNGRRHHALKFDDAATAPKDEFMTPPIVWGQEPASMVAAVSTPVAGGSKKPAAAGSAKKVSSKSKGKQKETPTRSTPAGRGRAAGDDSEDEGQRRPSTSSAPARDATPVIPAIDEQDPAWLLGPLQALRGSLRKIAEPYIRPRPPRPSTSMDVDEPLEHDNPSPWAVPLQLANVEDAYVRLTYALTRLHPEAIPDPTKTLAPLRDFRVTLRTCVERDLDNIRSFPTWVEETRRAQAEQERRRQQTEVDEATAIDSDDIVTSSPSTKAPNLKSNTSTTGPKKPSYSDHEMTRLRDEVGVAQAAIKCFSAISRSEVFSGILKPTDVDAILSTLLPIPLALGLAPLVCKDVFPFVAFYLRMQRLPIDVVTHHFPSILRALSTTLNQPDKNRFNLGESLSAVAALLEAHPRELLNSVDDWFVCAARGLWDTARRGASVRNRALVVLTKVARELTRHDADKEWSERKTEIRDKVATQFVSLMTETRGPGQSTGLKLLVAQIEASLPTVQTPPGLSGKVDEAPFLWLLQFLGVLPVLLGKLFRKLEAKGIRPYCDLFRRLETQPAPSSLRPLSALAWTHVAHAFALTPGSSVNDLWVMRSDGKPVTVVLSVFSHRRANSWIAPPSPAGPAQTATVVASPPRRENHKLQAEALARLVVALVGGLGEAVLSRCSGPTAISTELAETWFDQLFHKIAEDHLASMLCSSYDETRRLGWQTLAAIVQPASESEEVEDVSTRERKIDQLMIHDVFMNASVLELKDANQAAMAGRKAIERAIEPSSVRGWGSAWTTSRIGKVLDLVIKGSGIWDTGLDSLCTERGMPEATIESGIFPIWSNVLLAFEAQLDSDVHLYTVVNWLCALLTNPQAPNLGVSASGLVHRLLPAFFEKLGHRIVLLAAPASVGNKEPWNQLVSLLVESSSAFPAESTNANAFSAALLAALRLPIKVEAKSTLLRKITSRLASEEKVQVVEYAELADRLATKWWPVSFRDGDVTVDSMRLLVQLVRLYPRSLQWTEMGAEFGNVIAQGPKAKEIQDVLGTEAPNLKLAALFVSECSVESDDTFALDYARRVIAASLNSGSTAELVQVLEAASDSNFIALYSLVLESLKSVVEPSQASLDAVETILQNMHRVLGIMEADSQNKLADECVRVAFSFRDLWTSSFASAANLVVPAELVEIVSLLDGFEDTAATGESFESQATQVVDAMVKRRNGTMDVEPTSKDELVVSAAKVIETSSEPLITSGPTVPQAAQPLRTLETLAPTTDDPSSRPVPEPTSAAYEGDASIILPDRSSPESTFEDPDPTSAPPLRPLSPSLGVRQCLISPSLQQASPPSSASVLEETPLELEQLRHKRSFAEMSEIAEGSAVRAMKEEEEEELVETSQSLELEQVPSSVNEPAREIKLESRASRASSLPRTPFGPFSVVPRRRESQMVLDDSDSSDGDMLIAAPSLKRSVSSSSVGSHKSAKRAAIAVKRRSVSVASSEPGSVAVKPGKAPKNRRSSVVYVEPHIVKRGEAKRASSVTVISNSTDRHGEDQTGRRSNKTRSRKDIRSLSKKREISDASRGDLVSSLGSGSSSSSNRASSVIIEQHSAPSSPTTQMIKDSLRELFTRPVDQIVRAARDVGGTSGLNTLMELGEQARAYFERLAGSPSPTRAGAAEGGMEA